MLLKIFVKSNEWKAQRLHDEREPSREQNIFEKYAARTKGYLRETSPYKVARDYVHRNKNWHEIGPRTKCHLIRVFLR